MLTSLHELWDLLDFSNYVNTMESSVKFYPLFFIAFTELYITMEFKLYLNVCKVCPMLSVVFTFVIRVGLKIEPFYIGL